MDEIIDRMPKIVLSIKLPSYFEIRLITPYTFEVILSYDNLPNFYAKVHT